MGEGVRLFFGHDVWGRGCGQFETGRDSELTRPPSKLEAAPATSTVPASCAAIRTSKGALERGREPDRGKEKVWLHVPWPDVTHAGRELEATG